MDMVTRGVMINLAGLGSTLLGVSALVGILMAKALSNGGVNPFIATAAGVYNPVQALDVFLIQVGFCMLHLSLSASMPLGSLGLSHHAGETRCK